MPCPASQDGCKREVSNSHQSLHRTVRTSPGQQLANVYPKGQRVNTVDFGNHIRTLLNVLLYVSVIVDVVVDAVVVNDVVVCTLKTLTVIATLMAHKPIDWT